METNKTSVYSIYIEYMTVTSIVMYFENNDYYKSCQYNLRNFSNDLKLLFISNFFEFEKCSNSIAKEATLLEYISIALSERFLSIFLLFFNILQNIVSLILAKLFIDKFFFVTWLLKCFIRSIKTRMTSFIKRNSRNQMIRRILTIIDKRQILQKYHIIS